MQEQIPFGNDSKKTDGSDRKWAIIMDFQREGWRWGLGWTNVLGGRFQGAGG